VATDEKVFGNILLHGIGAEEFILHTEEFSFIQTYFNKYNSIPSKAVIESSFPGFTYLSDVKEHEIKYLCDELIKASTKRKAIVLINESSELMTKDPYGAIDSLVNRLSNIRKPVNYSRSYADADAPKRYAKAVENREKAAKGISTGLTTGIGLFDNKYLGWQPGNLIGIVGRLGVGKSTLAQYLACQTYKTGKRVLFLSPEMSVDEVHLRWDTFMGKMNGYTFLNDKLQTGEVNMKEYKKWLEEVKVRKDWLTLDSANGKKFNVSNIKGFINEFSPDLVVVDGVALLEGIGEQSWLKVMDVSYGLKSLAQNHKIVIMATMQANREVKDDMPRPDQVSFGDAFMQACDCGIFIQQNINKPDIRFITIPKRRNGKAINTAIQIDFDINSGMISV
jgi:replicative DNA helicase